MRGPLGEVVPPEWISEPNPTCELLSVSISTDEESWKATNLAKAPEAATPDANASAAAAPVTASSGHVPSGGWLRQ
jgi:hypothetical protein